MEKLTEARWWLLILCFLFVQSVFGKTKNETSSKIEIVPIGYSRIPARTQFQKTEVGGLSGIVFEESSRIFWTVSDDRGRINEPRIYGIKIELHHLEKADRKKMVEIPMAIESVVRLQVQKGELAHSGKKLSSKEFSKVLDLEGISLLPWGDFLLISEGDGGAVPRIPPQVFSAKKDGTIVKSYQVPDAFIPEAGGEQTKGVLNNQAFEGLSAIFGSKWVVATEGRLQQDKGEHLRWVIYESKDAFQLTPESEIRYPQTPAPEGAMGFPSGVTDLTMFHEGHYFVLERAVRFIQGKKPYEFQTELYSFQNGAKKRIYSMKDLPLDDLRSRNYEGITWGPTLPTGEKLLLIVSDNNFVRKEDSFIVYFAVKESP